MRKPEMRHLERLRHWQGEKLKRADFADQAAFDARRSAWHNRSLHETFGIVSGLTVTMTGGKASVAPGLGYDAQGNPLWLARPAELALPLDVAERVYYLVIAVPRGCGCGCNGAGAGLEWVPVLDWTSCDGLPLAVTAGTTAATLVPCEPRRIRPLARPRLHTGETVRGRTPWEIWEVSTPGQTARIQAGVQTRIDTSAYGFTTTPHYFASLQAPVWSSSGEQRPEFAPTYLAHVALPTPEGFVFRLLLKDIALRGFGVAQPTARVRELRSATFERLELQLEEDSPFAAGDAVTLVRPRGTRASVIRASDEELLQLDSTLGLAVADRVALGNLPRISRVLTFQSTQRTHIQPAGGMSIASGAVVAYLAPDGSSAVARVVSADATEAVLDRQWTPPEGSELRIAQAGVKPVRIGAAPAVHGTGIKVQVSAGRISGSDWVIALPPTGQQLSAPVRVSAVEEGEVTLAAPIATLAKNHRLLPLSQAFTITGLTTDAGTGIAQLETPGCFAEGDLVSVVERPASLAIVLRMENSQATLDTAANFTLNPNEHLVAANWEAAGTLLGAFPVSSQTWLWVADSGFFRTGDLLLKWQNTAGPPAPVEPRLSQLSAVLSTYSSLLATDGRVSFTRGDVVLAARFPFITSFVGVESGGRVRVAAAGFHAGDWIAPLDAPGEFRIAQITQQVAPDLFELSGPLEGLIPGSRLGVVHFATTGTVAGAETGDPPNSIRLEEAAEPRATGDFAAPLTHYFDNAPFSIVDQSAGKKLALRATGRFAGDGVVPEGLIDGGILALAALTPAQRTVRLEAGEAIALNTDVTASGLGPLENDQSVPMLASAFDDTVGRATLDPRVGVTNYSFRPERLNLLSAFNESFPERFAIFAQRQGLYVSWTACQDVDRSEVTLEDPPVSPCDETTEEDPCPCQA